jgi:PhoH-like ATPase
MKKKIFLLDTNVLIHNPGAIFSFEGAEVGIPGVVLEELEEFKREGTDRGRNTREVIRSLDALRARGSLGAGVKLDNGGTLRVIFLSDTPPNIPYHMDLEDNKILKIAVALQQQGYDVQFISKDLNARVKADALGVAAQDYVKEFVSEEEFYKGWIKIPVPAVQLKKDMPQELEEVAASNTLSYNEFVILESQHNPHNNRLFRYLGGKEFISVRDPQLKWPLKARNIQQLMALDLLLDNNVQCVSLVGPAGTGKTFLALLAGLHKVLVEDQYEKMLVARPVIPLGRDVGFLPGTLQEKLFTWMLPVYDNMELIVHSAGVAQHIKSIEDAEHEENGQRDGHHRRRRGGRHQHHKRENKHEKGALQPLDQLVRRGKISLEAITYMRGRSIPYQYILIDEVQNLTPHEVKTIISRAGEGSKIVLAGDPYQIDSPYLDFSSNGLIMAAEKLKGNQIFGSVYMETSERSKLSQLATQLL